MAPQAVLLGFVQGLTEFLPISSSGHLVFFQEIFDLAYGASFDIALHTGTLIATIVFFFPKLIRVDRTYLRNIIVGSIPAGLVGLSLLPKIESLFDSLILVSVGFITTTTLLFLTKNAKGNTSLGLRSSVIIGLAQAVAIIPGISRSGSTIATALLLGITQKEAFAFSFILSIPAVLGASLLNYSSLPPLGLLSGNYLLGMSSAAISGYISLKLLERVMQKSSLHKFALYTGPLALLTLYLSLR